MWTKIKQWLNYPTNEHVQCDDPNCIWTPNPEPCPTVGGVLAVVGVTALGWMLYHLYKVWM